MAQTTSRNQIYQSQQMQQLLTQQHNLFSQRHRLIAPASHIRNAPYAKSQGTSVYAAGTTLDSNNPAVVRRNARERNRVKQVNNGFLNLRQHIPTAIIADLSNGRRGIGPGANKKLSKVDTLRMAVEYIRRLQRVIDDVDNSDASSVSSYNSYNSSTSGSPPPPSPLTSGNYFLEHHQQQHERHHFAISYAGSFPLQQQPSHHQQQQQHDDHQHLFNSQISPASTSNSSSYDYSPVASASNINNSVSLKFEQSYDEYTSPSTDDEELLDYISLWQEDM